VSGEHSRHDAATIALLIAFSNLNLDVQGTGFGHGDQWITARERVCSDCVSFQHDRACETSQVSHGNGAQRRGRSLGAVEFAVVASNDWHPRPADILAILSAAVCGTTVPHLLRSEGRRKID
jgi:hypothetical protein